MKKILFLGALLFSFATVSAQAPLEKGEMQVNGGLGFSTYGVLPVSAGLDYCVYPNVTIGGEVTAYLNAGLFSFQGNGNYHFNELLEIPSKYDVYAGASLGFANALGFAAQVGGRYFFNDKFALNLEFGGGTVSGGKIGVTYKL